MPGTENVPQSPEKERAVRIPGECLIFLRKLLGMAKNKSTVFTDRDKRKPGKTRGALFSAFPPFPGQVRHSGFPHKNCSESEIRGQH